MCFNKLSGVAKGPGGPGRQVMRGGKIGENEVEKYKNGMLFSAFRQIPSKKFFAPPSEFLAWGAAFSPLNICTKRFRFNAQRNNQCRFKSSIGGFCPAQ